MGIVALEDAMKQAEDVGLDLMEVSPNSDPPVCRIRSEEHTSELQSRTNLVCRLLLEKKKKKKKEQQQKKTKTQTQL